MRFLPVFLLACSRQHPGIVAHRALGVNETTDENDPANMLAAFSAGYGAETDLRVDGDGCEGKLERLETDGCFDLGHSAPNGHTLAELLDTLESGWTDDFGGQTLLLDVVNDPDRTLTLALVPFLRQRLASSPLSEIDLMIQSSSVEGIALLRGQLDAEPVQFPLRLGITWFVNPSLTVPDSAEFAVVHIAELPLVPMPVPVAVFGVASESSYKQAIYAESEVEFVITDFPQRIEIFAGYE